MPRTPEAINSIEWAVLFAALVLTARLYSLIRAARGIEAVQAAVLQGLSTLDPPALERRARSLLYRNPYAEVASALVHAARLEPSGEARARALTRTLQLTTRRLQRRSNQGRAADLLTVAIGAIVIIYSRNLLLQGPLFWSCAGAMFVTLVATFATRGLLLSQLLSHAEALHQALLQAPISTQRATDPAATTDTVATTDTARPESTPLCPLCGGTARSVRCQVDIDGEQRTTDASLCSACGRLVGITPLLSESPLP